LKNVIYSYNKTAKISFSNVACYRIVLGLVSEPRTFLLLDLLLLGSLAALESNLVFLLSLPPLKSLTLLLLGSLAALESSIVFLLSLPPLKSLGLLSPLEIRLFLLTTPLGFLLLLTANLR